MKSSKGEESDAKARKRGTRTEAEVEEVLGNYRKSGLKVSEYARRSGVSAPSLYGWLRVRRARATNAAAKGFASVVLASGEHEGGMVTLRTATGWQVEVSGMGASYVAVLFKELISCLR